MSGLHVRVSLLGFPADERARAGIPSRPREVQYGGFGSVWHITRCMHDRDGLVLFDGLIQ